MQTYGTPVLQPHAPMQQPYAAPKQQTYAAPMQQTYTAPMQTYAAPVQQAYAAPMQQMQQTYAAPMQQTYPQQDEYVTLLVSNLPQNLCSNGHLEAAIDQAGLQDMVHAFKAHRSASLKFTGSNLLFVKNQTDIDPVVCQQNGLYHDIVNLKKSIGQTQQETKGKITLK